MKPDSRFLKLLDSVDSTNNYAMGRVHEGMAKHGAGWLAREQTSGKGQRGNQWFSEPGKNIAMSIVIDPGTIVLSSGFHLSAAVSMACYEVFNKYAGSYTSIKWPNDIYWRDRKAGGILIENIYRGESWAWAIIGIGMNINQENFGEGVKNAVSLKQISKAEQNIVAIADELYELVMRKITEPFSDLLKQYNEHLFHKNENVRLKKENAVFGTTIKCVNEFGQLVTEDVMERAFDFGTVEWISER
jgi:BirA family biotin operon repressor/biotin-[acetyl-CoA-carboxylase] ligase